MITRRFLIRCDGGALQEIGTGHVRRCLAIAEELKNAAGNQVLFLMRPTEWVDRIRAAGFTVLSLEEGSDADEQLVDAAREHQCDVVFLDDLGRSNPAIGNLQEIGCIVVSMDDPSQVLPADISINPAFPSPHATHDGLDRTILLSDLPARHNLEPQNDIFVSFGGFDPAGLNLRFLRACVKSAPSIRGMLAVGVQSPDLDELRCLADQLEHFEVHTNVNFAEELPRSRLAITNGGTTLFMAAAHGVPSFAVAQYEHQIGNAQRLSSPGASIFRGQAQEVQMDALITEVQELLTDKLRLEKMSRAGRLLFPGFGKHDAVDTLSVVEQLTWDSDFFGLGIATLHPRRLTKRIVQFALEQCRRSKIQCLYFLADGEHRPTKELATQNGFRPVDDRLTYLRPVRSAVRIKNPNAPAVGLALRKGCTADGPKLAQIAGTSYGDSRYFHDERFPRERCEQFYRDWILKSIEGRFDHAVLVAEIEGELAGYISCRASTPNLGSIGLVGVDPKFRGRGIAKKLVLASLDWFEERDLPQVEVVTQGRNPGAQKLYESCGFALRRIETWYHNWLDEVDTSSSSER